MDRVAVSQGWMWRAIFGIGIVLVLTAAALTWVFRDVESTSERAKTASELADKTADRAVALAAQNLKQDVDVVQSLRYTCGGLNQLRENQGFGISENVRQTERTLADPQGLNGLERFRTQIVEGLAVRKRQLRGLRRHAREFPVKGHPYRVNCERAHPFP